MTPSTHIFGDPGSASSLGPQFQPSCLLAAPWVEAGNLYPEHLILPVRDCFQPGDRHFHCIQVQRAACSPQEHQIPGDTLGICNSPCRRCVAGGKVCICLVLESKPQASRLLNPCDNPPQAQINPNPIKSLLHDLSDLPAGDLTPSFHLAHLHGHFISALVISPMLFSDLSQTSSPVFSAIREATLPFSRQFCGPF